METMVIVGCNIIIVVDFISLIEKIFVISFRAPSDFIL